MARLKDLHADKPHTLSEGHPMYRADALMGQAATDPDEAGPEDYSAEARAYRAKAGVCRDLLAEEPQGYLIQWEGEENAEFEKRKANSLPGFVNWYEEAVGGLVDKVFSRPLQLERVKDDDGNEADGLSEEEWAKLERFWQNVERRKRTEVDGTQFARDSCEVSLGHGGTPLIVIDFPPLPVDEAGDPIEATTAAEESERGAMPYFRLIHPWDLIAVEEDDDGNLDQVRYFSSQAEKTPWSKRVTSTVVVLERGGQAVADGDSIRLSYSTRRVLVYDDAKEEYIEDPEQAREFKPPDTLTDELKAKFVEIPAADLFTGIRQAFARPQLRNVSLLNVLHYRKRTDYDVAESVASVPLGAFFGVSEDDMKQYQRGPYRVFWTTKGPDECAYEDISFGFETAQISLKTLESIERYISVKSKDPQSQRATGEEKATIRLIDEAKKISRLQAWAIGWLQALQTSLQWAGWWMGLERVGVLSYLDEVFDSLNTGPTWADFQAFLATLSATEESAWPMAIREAKRYGVLSDTEDTEKLIEELSAGRLETEPPE